VNLKSAARQLGVHYQTAYRWVRSGQLVAVKVGAGYEVSDAALTRFEAQRSALERLPEPTVEDVTARSRPVPTRAEVLGVLDRMIDVITLDPGPVAHRAARYAAEVLGDAAIVSLRGDDGEIDVAAVAHRNPVAEVTVAAVARDVPFTCDVAQTAMRRDSSVFLPQVAQRAVRERLQPELHELLLGGSCYSLICAPIRIGVQIDGTLLMIRDAPGRPYERDDVLFVEEVADRIALARDRAEMTCTTRDTCRRVADAAATVSRERDRIDLLSLRELEDLVERAADDPQAAVAILDLDMRHVACTKPYALPFGIDRSRIACSSLPSLIDDEISMRVAFEAVRSGELDFRTVDARPVGDTAPIQMQVAVVRRDDATPWCTVVATHVVPQLAARPAGD
jgi:excisionase family DNA binding protein